MEKDARLSSVSYARVKGRSIDSFRRAILESLSLINYSFPKAENVVIKPNMCYYWDCSTGQTTDPRFVAALIETVREQISSSVDISIVESDASAMKCKYSFKMLGYERLSRDYDVNLVNLSEDESSPVDVIVGGNSMRFMLPQTIRKADLKIDVPKMKYMELTKISCALKNIYGCNPNPAKFKCHPRLGETIVALNKIMRFDVAILDGIIVAGRKPLRLDLVMASEDFVSLDAASAKLLGVNPKSIKHIMLAMEEGLGNVSFVSKGEDPEFFERKFPRERFRDAVLLSAYRFALRTGLVSAG